MDVAGWAKISSNAAVTDAIFNGTRRQSITDIGNDVLTDSLEATQTDTKTEIATIKDNYSEKIVDKEDALAISTFASSLSAMDLKLKNAGNTSGAEGLRQVAMHYAKNSEGFSNFMSSVEKMDDSTFQQFFKTVDKAADKGLKVGDMLDNVASASNATQNKNIVSSTNQILSDTTASLSDMKTTYNKLMSSLKSIENSDLTQTGKDNKVTNFFTAITKGTTVTDIGSAIDKFNNA